MRRALATAMALGSVATPAAAADVSVVRPRTEGRVAAMPLEAGRPRLTWDLDWGGPKTRQTFYQLRVVERRDAALPELVWDSGRVAGDATCVVYGGPPLRSGGRYSWQVRVWDGTPATSKWSAPAPFEMGSVDRDADPPSCPVVRTDPGFTEGRFVE